RSCRCGRARDARRAGWHSDSLRGMGDGAADRDFLARTARRAIVGGVVLAVVLLLLRVLQAALTPLAAAFVIADLLDPVIDRFTARRVSRAVAIFVLIGAVGALFLAGLLVVVPKMQREIAALAERMPGYLERLTTVVIPQLEARLGIQFPHTINDVIAR